jgi:hypothetical protein
MNNDPRTRRIEPVPTPKQLERMVYPPPTLEELGLGAAKGMLIGALLSAPFWLSVGFVINWLVRR